MAVEEPPYCAAATYDPSLAHRRDDLAQRQVRLLSNQSQQPFRMLFERRDAAAAWLCCKAASLFPALRPKNYHAGAQLVSVGRLTTRCTALDCFDHSRTQVVRIGSRHRCPQNRINTAETRSLTNSWESSQFNPTETCSRCLQSRACGRVYFSLSPLLPSFLTNSGYSQQ